MSWSAFTLSYPVLPPGLGLPRAVRQVTRYDHLGADGGSRTHMSSRTPDPKSGAYAFRHAGIRVHLHVRPRNGDPTGYGLSDRGYLRHPQQDSNLRPCASKAPALVPLSYGGIVLASRLASRSERKLSDISSAVSRRLRVTIRTQDAQVRPRIVVRIAIDVVERQWDGLTHPLRELAALAVSTVL